MEQMKILDQLSRDELYSIYQFLLLESRSPAETPRNASKSVMLETLGQVMTNEEARYCVDFFENYEYYAVPVLKTEMIDALPDDLLQALFAIYLDDDILPEDHLDLVDALGQSQFFLKEDARKFYLWYYYFRERIPIEQDSPQEQTVLVAGSFSSSSYDDAAHTQRMAGFSSADMPSFETDEAQETQRLQGFPARQADEYAAALAGEESHTSSNEDALNEDALDEDDLDEDALDEDDLDENSESTDKSDASVSSPFSSASPDATPLAPPPPPPEAFQRTPSAIQPLPFPSLTSHPSEAKTTGQPAQRPNVPPSMRTIELDVLDLENYANDASQKQGTSTQALREQLKQRIQTNPPPQPPNEEIEELDPEAIIEEPDATDFRNEETQPLQRPQPNRPPQTNVPPKPPPPSGTHTQSPPPPRSKEPERPTNGQRPPSKSPEQPPNEQRSPSNGPEQPPSTTEPKAPPKALQGALALTPAHIDQIATVLYRSALLGATYARPQIRAIRIYFQKILDCSPAQLHRVRDILKKLQSQEFPLVPPPLDDLPALVPMLSYAKRLAFVHSILFLLGCKTLQTLERYRDFMSELAIELRIDPADVSLFNLFGIGSDEIQLSFQDCLRVLDVEMDATENDLRKAHRELVRRYHPDQFHSKGPEFVRLAERKMKEANMALEILLYRSDRGV